MKTSFLQKVYQLSAEEKILNCGIIVALLGVFLPWISGRIVTAADVESYTGFGFYTSFVGLTIFVIHVYALLITFVPLTSSTVLVQPLHKHIVRLYCAAVATILTIASLSVLTKVTFEFPGLEVRFGIYMTLLGSLASLFYAYITYMQQKQQDVQQLFHQDPTSYDAKGMQN